MTGAALGVAACYGCGRIFAFNPHRVPSIAPPRHPRPVWLLGLFAYLPAGLGPREPICADCVTGANPGRAAAGLPPIVPAPDAYDPVAVL